MLEIDEISQDLMKEFLEDEFPIVRVRQGRRFKRCIIVDDTYINGYSKTYFHIKEQKDLMAVYPLMAHILDRVFAFEIHEVKVALTRYLSIV